MKSWLLKFIDNLRTSLWFIPTLMTISSALLSLLTQYADEFLLAHSEGLPWVESIIYPGEPAGARTVLGAIAGSMITVAGTVFSITIVALSLASSQFGPRLLRNFLSDRGNQTVLGTFIATFLYCILVMRRVYSDSGQSGVDVPAVSVSVAIVLAVVSLGVLIYFIHHISQSMQAGYIVSSVYEELKTQVENLFPKRTGSAVEPSIRQDEVGRLEALIDSDGKQVVSAESGYIQGVDADGLLLLAEEQDLVLRIALRPGDFVLPGAALVLMLPHEKRKRGEKFERKVRDCFALDVHRTPHQNIEFGIDQIVEVAVRALSPGINDPFTAMACVDRLGAVLALLTNRETPSPYRTCSSGKIRLIVPPVSYKSLVARAFNQIRQNARTIPAVTIRLTETIARIGERESTSRRQILLRQLSAISEQITAIESKVDREDLGDRIARAREALLGAELDPHEPSREAMRRHYRRLEELKAEA